MAFPGKKISHPFTGQSNLFLQTAEDTEGALLEMETVFQGFSPEPSEHYHPYQDELFTVISGELTIRLNGTIRKLTPGQQICIPRNTPHSMWNNSGRPTTVNWKVTPALESAELLENLIGLANDGKTNKQGRPSILQIALLAKRYEAEFRLSRPSYFIQKLLFVVLRPLARMAGYQDSYSQYID